MSTPETTEPDIDGALDRTLGVDTSADRAPAEETLPATPEAPESGADAPAGIVAGGRTFKDEAELAKAYAELQASYSSTRPAEPEPEPEYVDPWASVPGVDPNESAKLVAWATDDPLSAGQWAWENRSELPDKIANDLISHAMQSNPAGWEIYRHEQYAQMATAAAEEKTSGWVQQQINDVAQVAGQQIAEKLGTEEYAKYKDRIDETIKSGQFVMPQRTWAGQVPPPEVLLQVQYQIYRGLWMDDHFDELQKAGAKPSPSAAATQTKSSAAAPKDGDVEGALDRALGLA